MRSLFVSAALALMVGGATAAAQTPTPGSSTASPQAPAPPGQAQTSNVTPPTISASLPGPINATGTTAAYVAAEANGRPAVFIGSDTSPYGIVGTFTNHPLGFRTNNIGRMFIDLSGNVGIGTTVPGYKLDVSGDANITGTYRVNGVPISATSNWTQAGNNIFYTTGNVGIGVTFPPSARLHVEGGTDNAVFGSSSSGTGVFGTSTGAYGVLGSSSSGIAVLGSSSSGIGVFGVSNDNVAVYGNGQSGDGVYGTSVSGHGVSGNSISNVAVYGISYSGQGVSGTSNTGNGVAGWSTSGTGVSGYSSTGWAGYFDGPLGANGVVCATNVPCGSDARLKQDITPLSYGLREVLQLRPVRWQWKDTATTQLNLGLVAQEVEPVLPELILHNVDTKGSLGLSYFGFVPVLINAIQEQQHTITALKAENASLDTRIRALERAMQRLHEPR